MNTSDDLIDYEAYKVATILACLPKHVREPLIGELTAFEPSIGDLALRFEDLVQINKKGILALVDEVDYQDLVHALTYSDDGIKQRFYQSLGNNAASQLKQDISETLQHDTYELELMSLNGKIAVIVAAAKLRQDKIITLDPPGFYPDYVTEELLKDISQELQQACERAMAEVLTNYMPEAAAAVLCQRLDRSQILQQMLQQSEFNQYDVLSEQEINELLGGIDEYPDDD